MRQNSQLAAAGMTRHGERMKLPRGLLAAFAAVVLLPSVMLVTLGVRLHEQDRALEERRRREIAEASLERAAGVIHKDIAAIQRRLAAGTPWSPADLAPGAVLLRKGAGRLLYLPALPTLPEPPEEPFAEADRAEFNPPEPAKALEICTRLAASPNQAIRAGALLRLARLHRKSGNLEAALSAWERLAGIDGVAIAGEPAGLVARRARCRAFEESGRKDDLERESLLLLQDLFSARWPIDREAYLRTLQQGRQWSGQNLSPTEASHHAAAAALSLYPQRTGAEGARCLGASTLIWQGDDALLIDASYRQARWQAPLRVTLACRDEAAPSGLARQPALTGLPWLIATSLDAGPLPEFSARRAALFSALVALIVLLCAVAYFAWRAITRELGVARLQSDFVAAVSHEFRTPLTSLRQFNEMLVEEPELPADARLSYYEAQGRATSRLSRLVETLLDFGRMEAGRRPYRLELLDAGSLVKEIAAEFSREPASAGFDIQCRVPEHPLVTQADRDALWRAVWNLLDNAVKYSGDRREILIEAAAQGAGVVVRVVDHGLGIPRQEQARLFQKFVRGDSIRRLGIPGTGIGLAMVRHIAEAHGGRVVVSSEEGQGSTFSLLLPGKG